MKMRGQLRRQQESDETRGCERQGSGNSHNGCPEWEPAALIWHSYPRDRRSESWQENDTQGEMLAHLLLSK